jgi:hypothetical protein
MGEPTAEVGRKRVRSPSFPFISLRIALDRVLALYEAEKRSAIRPETAAAHWRYSDKSSGGKQTLAALRQFGLIEGEGVVKVTDRAVRMLLDQREGSAEREQLLKQAALLPPLHTKLWEKYGPRLPDRSTLRLSLIMEDGFNDNAVDEFITEYRETLELAKLLTDSENDLPRESPTSQRGAAQNPLPFPRPIPAPRIDLTPEVDPVVFPLLDGNAVEFRIRRKISSEEAEDLRAMFEIWLRKIVER